jgi:hypothetical protein
MTTLTPFPAAVNSAPVADPDDDALDFHPIADEVDEALNRAYWEDRYAAEAAADAATEGALADLDDDFPPVDDFDLGAMLARDRMSDGYAIL